MSRTQVKDREIFSIYDDAVAIAFMQKKVKNWCWSAYFIAMIETLYFIYKRKACAIFQAMMPIGQ
jgi:hypothetical protein